MIPAQGVTGKNVAVLGLGRSGLTAALALRAGGAEAADRHALCIGGAVVRPLVALGGGANGELLRLPFDDRRPSALLVGAAGAEICPPLAPPACGRGRGRACLGSGPISCAFEV